VLASATASSSNAAAFAWDQRDPDRLAYALDDDAVALAVQTLLIFGLGLFAIVIDTVGGVLLGITGLIGEKRLPIRHRDLVVIGVNLAESQKSLTIAAEIDEGGL
jgi:hypothetical protein